MLHCSSLVARLPVCLASGDNDIVHWSVVLLHDLVLSEGLCSIGSLIIGRFTCMTNNNVITSYFSMKLYVYFSLSIFWGNFKSKEGNF